MQVALYLRVSTDKQAEQGVSINDQLIQMKTWAASNGHEVVNVYEEAATATDDRRQALLKMIEDAVSDEHPFDAIVVHSQSRFFRNAYQFAYYELKLTKSNVKLISITQPLSDDGGGAMMRQIVSVFDEYQSKECAKHVMR
jgi:DNA invertase Pin-like site-specific DNA recombinase